MKPIYDVLTLNGAWEMDYRQTPWQGEALPEFEGYSIADAVPGYWEDMTGCFQMAPFFRSLRINPEYGVQRYPIAEGPPDMALPNITGCFLYRRSFCCGDVERPSVVYFSGVQNAAKVWLNGVYLGAHEGYSTPFEMPIPAGCLQAGENSVVMAVSNIRLKGYDDRPVSGLTSRAANECTGGVTGDVELRFYNTALRDAAVRVSPDCESFTVEVESAEPVSCRWELQDGDRVLASGINQGDLTLDAAGLRRWTPEEPKQYTIVLSDGEFSLERKFGIRRLTAVGTQLHLNGEPYFLRGITEHCYFPETVHPVHDIRYYRNIIRKIKKLGFNFIRFHTWIPPVEYMEAADELGMLMHVESPNNTSLAEWEQIVSFCRRYTCAVIYCCGNELLLDDPFLAHLKLCADVTHAHTDALFSPMSALRGLEYYWLEPGIEKQMCAEPFPHNPRRIALAAQFSDMYSSYANGLLSYTSLDADPAELDRWSEVYNKPRVSHEICIDGTYADLSLQGRYKGTRVGKTEMFSSVEAHLQDTGLLCKAPLYFRNSAQWQCRVRKHCFEAARRCEKLAGYDFLGNIDTHWHTFGYDVGMMNEFYELKPGETERRVRMYNSETVLLNDLGTDVNFTAGQRFCCRLFASHFGQTLDTAALQIRLSVDEKTVLRRTVRVKQLVRGRVTPLYTLKTVLPKSEKPYAMKLYVSLAGGQTDAENEWELYAFPKTAMPAKGKLLVMEKPEAMELEKALASGRNVLLLGAEPFKSLPTSFRIALAGRTAGNLATVIADHPLLEELPHDGFCGWQFRRLLEDGAAVQLEGDVPFEPILEVVSTHKMARRQAALFEYRVGKGKLLVCSLHFSEHDPAAQWLKARLIAYAKSEAFDPAQQLSFTQLNTLLNAPVVTAAANTNLAFNANDKTMK